MEIIPASTIGTNALNLEWGCAAGAWVVGVLIVYVLAVAKPGWGPILL